MYGKVYTSDSLLETVLYWGINCSSKWSLKKKIKVFLLFLIGENRHGIGKRWLFLIGNGAEIRPLEKGRKSPNSPSLVNSQITEEVRTE